MAQLTRKQVERVIHDMFQDVYNEGAEEIESVDTYASAQIVNHDCGVVIRTEGYKEIRVSIFEVQT